MATNTVPSQSVSAEKTPEQARATLQKIIVRFPGYIQPVAMAETNLGTFCSCCGSQVINHEGKIHVSTEILNLEDGHKIGESHYKRMYGPDAEKRFAVAEWQRMMQQYERRNRPGVTLSFLPKEETLSRLYTDPKLRDIAEGYEISDKDEKYVTSVLWVNA